MAERKSRSRRREKKSVPKGKAYIRSSFNNTIITLTDPNGNVISAGSSGAVGFKGSRKSTPYAAGLAAEREAASRSLQGAGLSVLSIRDVTPLPHTGCRAKKRPRN